MRRTTRMLVAVAVAVAVVAGGLAWRAAGRPAVAQPAGFSVRTVAQGLTLPTAARFTEDGQLFVAEKSGLVKRFDTVLDPTPTVVADLRTQTHDYWDRGLLGLAVDPAFTRGRPYLYVAYTLDGPIGATPPVWDDGCPTPPGPNDVGCTAAARLSRLTIGSAGTAVEERVLIEDWCIQSPSHTVGDLVFLPDGTLAVSGGDGAHFVIADYGQRMNPCGDPTTPRGTPTFLPDAEGGALRSQDVFTTGDPTGLAGSVIRIDPETGQAVAGNPFAGDADPNRARIIASGLRNPFRMAVRPGTSEVWVADVGWGTAEEINRITRPGTFTNFGWPCYEGPQRQATYESLGTTLCSTLYSTANAVTPPAFGYARGARVAAGDTCGTGSQSISGLAFSRGGSYPAAWADGLFFADYSRGCIWFAPTGADGLPDFGAVRQFLGGVTPVDLQIGPGGDLFYVDIAAGAVRRVVFDGTLSPPTARLQATPTSGEAPLTVTFDASGSTDPDPGDLLVFAWDLDGDGLFDDGEGPTATWTYASTGTVTAAVRVTDSYGLSAVATQQLTVGDAPPVPVILSPATGSRFDVGATVAFSGRATDTRDGTLPATALSWTLASYHCTPDGSDCHFHDGERFDGVASGSFAFPDHDPSYYVELTLTARDRAGLLAATTIRLDPNTVPVTLASDPPGLTLSVGGTSAAAPFTVELPVGGRVDLSAPATQAGREFVSWSTGGPRVQSLTVPAVATTYTATYRSVSGASLATWEGRPGWTLDAIPVNTPPTSAGTVDAFAAPVNRGSDFGTRLRATLTVPATGTYTFWVASDDVGVLLASTTNDPLTRRVIASVPGWTNPGEYDKYPEQRSATVELTAGQQVFLEAYAKEAAGGDHLSVAWQGPGIPTREVIPGQVLSPVVATGACPGWCPEPGGAAVLDTWTARPGYRLADIPAGAPATSTTTLNRLETPPNRADDLGSRMRATLIAPATGTYAFWIASDDEGVLWLSTDDDPANQRVIARTPAWTPPRAYDVYPTQRSVPVELVAGRRYHLEAWAKEGGGADHLSVAWLGPGIPTRQVVAGSVLAAAEPGCPGWCPAGPPRAAVRMDTWTGRPGWRLGDIPVGTAPSSSATISGFAAPAGAGDDRGTRLRAVLTAPATGTYTFWIASDDFGVLNLGTDETAEGRRTIARVDGWTLREEYTKYPGQQSAPIELVAGRRYFIEAYAKEGFGDDHLSVVWQGPGMSSPRPIDPALLSPTAAGPPGWSP